MKRWKQNVSNERLLQGRDIIIQILVWKARLIFFQILDIYRKCIIYMLIDQVYRIVLYSFHERIILYKRNQSTSSQNQNQGSQKILNANEANPLLLGIKTNDSKCPKQKRNDPVLSQNQNSSLKKLQTQTKRSTFFSEPKPRSQTVPNKNEPIHYYFKTKIEVSNTSKQKRTEPLLF